MRRSLVADGDFGPKSTAAVQSFQTEKGLGGDPIIGTKTWEALRG